MNHPLFNLLHLCDPTLPIGGFSHSASLETYVQKDIVKDVETAKSFIHEMLSQSVFYNDALFLSLVFDACKEGKWDKVIYYDACCNATKLPKEMRESSKKLGVRLYKVFEGLCKHPLLEKLKTAIDGKSLHGHYCIVYGIISYALLIEKEEALTGYFYNAAVGFVTNCVKLIPLGQKDGQKILFECSPLISKLVRESIVPDIELMGLCAVGFDIRSMQHENLYSRLYMS